jgi:hypothetical protein
VDKLKELLNAGPSRRQFLAGVGAAGATAMVVGCGSNTASNTPTTTPVSTTPPANATDLDVLNFALNLEYLEASFYLLASTGSGIPAANQGVKPGTVTGGSAVPFTPQQSVLQAYAAEIAQEELNHVIFLRAAITEFGGTPVDMPNIDFSKSFQALAGLAGISGTFNPFADPLSFLVGAFVFEDVGVTAYHGGALLLTNKEILTAAASIHAVEAYHAAEVRTLIVGMASVAGASQAYLNDCVSISNLRAAVGGGMETAPSASHIVACDPTTSIGYKRSTDQVLHIVYGAPPGAGVKGGAFFPNGLNGSISVTAA